MAQPRARLEALRGVSTKTQVAKHLTGTKVGSRCGQLAESLELNGDKDTKQKEKRKETKLSKRKKN